MLQIPMSCCKWNQIFPAMLQFLMGVIPFAVRGRFRPHKHTLPARMLLTDALMPRQAPAMPGASAMVPSMSDEVPCIEAAGLFLLAAMVVVACWGFPAMSDTQYL